MMKGIVFAAAALVPAVAVAEVTPRAGAHDPRIREARYVDGQVYNLALMQERVTSIEFGPGEEIVSVVAGDTDSFDFDAVPGGRAVVVKPRMAGARTNITVFTDKHTYYFAARESKDAEYYAVRFSHSGGSSAAAPSKAVQRRAPNANYGADALTSITPRQVWDDGTFTYFKFRSNGEMPSIFSVSAGRERSVNSQTMNDGTVRVSGTSPYWVLRVGDIGNTIAMMGAVK